MSNVGPYRPPYTCWRTGQTLQSDRSASQPLGDSAGAPPSNTAPANYIDTPQIAQILGAGIDSLYFSYPGALRHSWDFELEFRKRLARSPYAKDREKAQVLLGGSLFRVEPYGSRRFAYVLQGDFFRMEVSARGNKSRPLAYVQIASELLWQAPLDDIRSKLHKIVDEMGTITGEPLVSRVDLCMDFVTQMALDEIREEEWISQARKIRRYTEDKKFTGFDFGLGGSLGARLYDKSRELVQSDKEFFKDLWKLRGWDGASVVWRLEFEIKREKLKDFCISSVTDLLESVVSVWSYCSANWLRLPIPSELDSNTTRWRTHPFWSALQNFPPPAEFTQKEVDLSRKPCAPGLLSIYERQLSVLTSFMAIRGSTDVDEALKSLAQEMRCHYNFIGDFGGESFRTLVDARVREKVRRFNISLNPSKSPSPGGDIHA